MSSTYNIFIFQKNRQTQCLRWLSAFFAYPSVENGLLYHPTSRTVKIFVTISRPGSAPGVTVHSVTSNIRKSI